MVSMTIMHVRSSDFNRDICHAGSIEDDRGGVSSSAVIFGDIASNGWRDHGAAVFHSP